MKAEFREFKPGILIAEALLRMPLMDLPVRSTAVAVGPKQWVLFSPLNPKKCDYESLRRHGDVVAIVAPSLMHHLFVLAAQKEFPNAKLWGVPGLDLKREDVKWDFIFGTDSWPYQTKIEPFSMAGAPKLNEYLFLLKDQKALLVTDLFFNLLDAKGWGAWLILSLFGTYRRFGISRFFRMMIKDRRAARQSLEPLLNLDFTSILLAHGSVVNTNAKSQVKAELAKWRL